MGGNRTLYFPQSFVSLDAPGVEDAFGIDKILNPKTAREIYDECNEKLKQPEYSARGMMRRYHVETVCTTDDPLTRWNIISRPVRADLR